MLFGWQQYDGANIIIGIVLLLMNVCRDVARKQLRKGVWMCGGTQPEKTFGCFGSRRDVSIDFGHNFMHFYAFITGTDSFGAKGLCPWMCVCIWLVLWCILETFQTQCHKIMSTLHD